MAGGSASGELPQAVFARDAIVRRSSVDRTAAYRPRIQTGVSRPPKHGTVPATSLFRVADRRLAIIDHPDVESAVLRAPCFEEEVERLAKQPASTFGLSPNSPGAKEKTDLLRRPKTSLRRIPTWTAIARQGNLSYHILSAASGPLPDCQPRLSLLSFPEQT